MKETYRKEGKWLYTKREEYRLDIRQKFFAPNGETLAQAAWRSCGCPIPKARLDGALGSLILVDDSPAHGMGVESR